MSTDLAIIFPNQLFEEHPALKKGRDVIMVEDQLFYKDFNYTLNIHKKKLVYLRACMHNYSDWLIKKGYSVKILEYKEFMKDKWALFNWIKENKYKQVHYADTVDFILEKRLTDRMPEFVELIKYDSPAFLCSKEYISNYFKDSKRYLLHNFYIEQRKRFQILTNENEPVGKKWSLDEANRKKLPKNIDLPEISWRDDNKYLAEAKEYINKHFPKNIGSYENFNFPTNFSDSKKWLNEFIEQRFSLYGDYQDAMSNGNSFLFHSLLSPLINIGLLTPNYVIAQAIIHADNNDVELNSLEGFIRQVLGWREFIRGIYQKEGVKQRTTNFWNNKRKIPDSFYDGTTGIDPVDDVIKRALKTGYSHHIERLMILSNFMLLCEFNPDAVYNWFMEMYLDAYDWVMVPNVYGMGQYADGGLMSTKPYISSSNYIRKMSDYKKGEWCEIWDGLFWHFIDKHQNYFTNNNRTVFMGRQLQKMDSNKLKNHIETAESFLNSL
jgi:deoxyribodipyrimidine photolyase-related protein